MTLREQIEARHQPTTRAGHGKVLPATVCGYCSFPWPCDAHRALLLLPDRDALARALVFHDFYDQDAGHLTLRPTQENVDAQKPEADRLLRIIAALEASHDPA